MAGANGSSRWTDALLDCMRTKGDPVADEPVGTVFERRGVEAVNAIMQTLVRNDQLVPEELPDELQDYLAAARPLPAWADIRRIERGQKVFETWGLHIAICLFCASLPSSYAAAKGVQVLHLTARLQTDPRRRVMETGQFLFDVLTVGGLGDNGKGRRTIERVRLMHAAVRHLIKALPEHGPKRWDPHWGEPINQEDLAGTLLAFSYIVGEPMRHLGVRLSAADIDAYLHLWNVIGHLMGVQDKLIAHDIADATALVDVIRRRQFRASEAGRELTCALLTLLDELTPFHEFDATIPPLIRQLIGDKTADLLLVPESDLEDDLGRLARISDWLFVHTLGQTERGTARYHLASRMARPFSRDLLHGLFRLERGGVRAPFTMPDHLARRWELSADIKAVAVRQDRR
jgi:hypothetical protein